MRGLALALVAVAVLALPASVAAYNDYSKVRIVRVSLVEGDVQIQRADEPDWEQAIVNMPIRHGDRLATGSGRAEIEFENGATARLAENSALEFTELALADGARITRLRLNEGTATFSADLARNEVFLVVSPHLEVTIPDKATFRLDVDAEGTVVSMHKGDARVETSEGSYRLAKGRSLFFRADQVVLARNPEKDAWDRWVEEREGVVYAGRDASLRYVSAPFSYGLADLWHYGSWVSLPGYGRCWRPWGVGAGWSPFLLGRWAFLRGLGWTWISYEPWGWVPYHYGSWIHLAGRGWFWVPGGFPFLHLWHPGPVHWFRHGTKVGWCARSPHDRPGLVPGNLPNGAVANSPRGLAGAIANARLRLRDGERPTVVPESPVRPEEVERLRQVRWVENVLRGGRTAGTATTAAPAQSPARTEASANEPRGIASRVRSRLSETGIVYDPQTHRYVNDPGARLRPTEVHAETNPEPRRGISGVIGAQTREETQRPPQVLRAPQTRTTPTTPATRQERTNEPQRSQGIGGVVRSQTSSPPRQNPPRQPRVESPRPSSPPPRAESPRPSSAPPRPSGIGGVIRQQQSSPPKPRPPAQ